MNDRRLRIYLDDHLALMVAEVELIGRCWRSNRSTPLGEFLQQLENEVTAQKSIARDMMHRIGGAEGIESKAKQSAAWLAEKLGRFTGFESTTYALASIEWIIFLGAAALFFWKR